MATTTEMIDNAITIIMDLRNKLDELEEENKLLTRLLAEKEAEK